MKKRKNPVGQVRPDQIKVITGPVYSSGKSKADRKPNAETHEEYTKPEKNRVDKQKQKGTSRKNRQLETVGFGTFEGKITWR